MHPSDTARSTGLFSKWPIPWYTLALLLLVFLAGFFPRFIDIARFLPYYSIDENDVVEYAIGYLGGDLDPHWYKYGPLYSYLLGIIYWILSWFHTDPQAFIQHYFIDGSTFYYTARLVNSLLNIVLAILTFRILQKFFKTDIAWMALVLAIFPFFDSLTGFTVRVDTLQAVWVAASVYHLLALVQTGKAKNYLFAALFTGLSVATKPLPALLILPTFFLAHVFMKMKPRASVDKKQLKLGKKTAPTALSFTSALPKSLTDYRLYLFLGGAVLASILFNPYSYLNYDLFREEQLRAISEEGARNFLPGWDIRRFFGPFGHAFTLLGFASLVYVLIQSLRKKDQAALIMVSYPLIYFLAFAKGAAREYFYITMVPFMIISMVLSWQDLMAVLLKPGQTRQWITMIFSILLLAQPAYGLISRSLQLAQASKAGDGYTALAAENWIRENIPGGTGILYYGYYTNMPRLLHSDAQKQAGLGEYFMYYRYNNEYLKRQYFAAHQNYLAEGGLAYQVENSLMVRNNQGQDVPLSLRNPLGENEKFLMELFKNSTFDYLVTYYDLSGIPEFEPLLVREFDQASYPFGVPLKIYKNPVRIPDTAPVQQDGAS